MNEESARRDLEDALRQLKESREVLSENQRVITWLNRQLNDAKMEKENAAITRKSYVVFEREARDFQLFSRSHASITSQEYQSHCSLMPQKHHSKSNARM